MDRYLLLRVKNLGNYIILICLLLMQEYGTAQINAKVYQDSIFNKYATKLNQPYTTDRYYYVMKWEGASPQDSRIIRQLDERMAIIEVNSLEKFASLKQQTKIALATDQWKFSSSAGSQFEKNNKEQQFILSSLNTDALLNLLQYMKGQVKIISVDYPSHSVVVKTTGRFLKDKLLPLKELIFVDVRAEPHSEINIIGYNRSFHGLNAVDYSIPGVNGKNIVTGVKEQKMEENDLDLYKRVLPSSLAASGITNHATVISTIIGGAGNSFYDGRGIAYGCKFFPSSFANLFADDAATLNASKVTVQNHSYGTVIQQFYGAEAVSYDVQTWQNKNLLHVFSAGNMGASFASDGRYANITGYANLTGNFKMAKNIMTVGAIDNKGNVSLESSAGPLYDGRLAPQLIALGPNGTSDAAAIVSGTIAVMQQVYADSNNQSLPMASLMKAVLYNATEDLYRTGIDYKTGYGLLNSYAAIKAIQQKEYDGGTLAQNQQWTKTITVLPNAAQLKVTLTWTDSAATVNNNKALINDLDLEVQEISTGTVNKPWVLSSIASIDSLAKLPTRKRDSLNTAEQVSLQLPAAGNYQVKVIGTSVSNSSLPFHIAYHTDTLNTFTFTSPQHASDVNRAEDVNLVIRWGTFLSDTNQTGNLFISYNKGTDWQLLKQSLKIYSNQYQWSIKDTSSTAIFKMETSFGNFLSKDFIISKVNRPSVDFLCIDSFQLSWNKHVYASAYKVYTLTDSAYLKHILTVTDTVVVMKRSAYPSLVYAVEPVLSNNLPASRSIAFDITIQGVKCFYKTFYYDLQDENKLNLVLELSPASYVDSVFFEQLSSAGQWLQTIGNAKVFANTSIYHQLASDLPNGTSYWRARIKLKTGTILYTEIISALTSGKKYILFYPNPTRRNGLLTFVLQQGLPSDSKLQLFDITGRLLKSYGEIPNSIDLRSLTPGMFIYKLFTSDNRLLETGKLVIQ